ncbi:Maltose acetyltransferase [Rhodospirillales bacterium URHD0017]|nr:Maltose acetyltransferase [Rhodospirillales bacterium URHD0017]
MKTERQKMLDRELYDPMDAELVAGRTRARNLCQALNATREAEADERRRLLGALFGAGGETVWMQPPFFCDYGTNIELGEQVFFNFNCVVLDVCRVEIASFTLFGPAVQIYTATPSCALMICDSACATMRPRVTLPDSQAPSFAAPRGCMRSFDPPLPLPVSTLLNRRQGAGTSRHGLSSQPMVICTRIDRMRPSPSREPDKGRSIGPPDGLSILTCSPHLIRQQIESVPLLLS